MATSLKKNLFALLFGLSLSLLIAEIIARIAPATDAVALKRPIKCSTGVDSNFDFTIECFHRKPSNIIATYTQGIFRPSIVISPKRSNDIGQFSDIDFSSYLSSSDKNIRIVAIGDSYVDAVQAPNYDTFHGRLNKYFSRGVPVVSTALGSSGMALPNYLAYFKFLSKNGLTSNDYVVIPIIGNDFDESFPQYGIKGRRGGQGQFFFDPMNHSLIFNPWGNRSSVKDKTIDFLISNSALVRYLTYNLSIGRVLKSNFSFFRYDKPQRNKYIANTVNTTADSDPDRFSSGSMAINIFLENMHLESSRILAPSRILFVVDCDRSAIYQNSANDPNSFYQTMRAKFIKNASHYKFSVIDMCPAFQKSYSMNSKPFNSPYDFHWNSYGHEVVADEIARHLSLTVNAFND